MKIGIDARFLTHPQVGGFKTYTSNLINALSQVDSENQYHLYLDRPSSDCILPQSKNFTYHVVPFRIPVIGMPYREQVALRRQIAQDEPDIVHFLANTAPVRMSKRYILTLHDTIQVSNPFSLNLIRGLSYNKIWAITIYSKWSILRTARNAVSIITVSNYEKDQIARDLEIPYDRISVTHLAPNPIFKPAYEETKKGWRKDIIQKFGIKSRFILGIGHEPRKRINDLISAFAEITTHYTDLDLVIVSAEENQRAAYQQIVDNLNISDRVVILAGLPQSDLMILQNLAEIFVYPSERESFGLPPLEAMACGTPVITTKTSSIPEIVGNGAYLIDKPFAKDISKAILHVLTDQSLKNKLIVNGLNRAAKFSWEVCARQTIEIYRNALGANNK